MKKIKTLLGLLIFVMFFGIKIVSAASGPVYVYYEGSSRYPTYTYTNTHMGSLGYSVYARDNWDSSGLLYALDDAKIVVFHDHGSPGLQTTGHISGNSYGIVAQNGDGTYFKSVNSMSSGSMSQAKMAIMYGCSTGDTSSTYGNLPLKMVNKGAQTAVAWTVTTYVDEVNEWNRLFFEKAKNDTIVEGYRHADYWIEYTISAAAKARMQNNRNEAGNIYGYVY